MATTVSPGPGSGTTMVTNDTGSPLANATIPWTSDAIVCSLSILASLYSGHLQVRGPWHRRRSTCEPPRATTVTSSPLRPQRHLLDAPGYSEQYRISKVVRRDTDCCGPIAVDRRNGPRDQPAVGPHLDGAARAGRDAGTVAPHLGVVTVDNHVRDLGVEAGSTSARVGRLLTDVGPGVVVSKRSSSPKDEG